MTAARPGSDDPWIRCLRSDGAHRVRLICFPHAGGSASYFFPWSRSPELTAEVWAIQYPGRQERRREPCITDASELTERIHSALKPWTDAPFAFFGHSMGAVLAYEVARLMEADGHGPARLFVSGRRAPSRPREEHVHQGADAALVDEIRRIGGTDEAFLQDPELLQLILPVVRADYSAIENYTYTPGPPLSCGITALVGAADPKATVEEAAAWAEHTAGPFDQRVFPGDHFYLDQCRPEVLATISSALRDRPAAAPGPETRH